MEIVQYLNDIDTRLMLWLNYDGGAFLDQFWWIISGKFTWIPLYLYLIWLLVKRCQPVKIHWKELTLLILLTVLVVVLSDQISSGLIKPLVMRPRPARPDSGISDLIHIVNDYRGGHYGFVSSHAANTWGIALWFILLMKGNRQNAEASCQQTSEKKPLFPLRSSLFTLPSILALFTILNCYSRMYLGVHYPGDILGGLIVGTISALFVYFVLLPLGNRWIK